MVRPSCRLWEEPGSRTSRLAMLERFVRLELNQPAAAAAAVDDLFIAD